MDRHQRRWAKPPANGTVTAVSRAANGLPSNIILALADDPSGDLWVGTPDGLARIQDRKITTLTSADGLADDFVRSLYASRDGSLWIGTRRGLSHLQNGMFTTYTRMDGLGSDLVGALLEDRHGTLWIGTLGGLSRLSEGKFATLTIRDGLTSNVVTALHEHAEGTLWIGTNGGGLNRLRQGVLASYPGAKTGLPDNVYGILEDAAGRLWLSSNKGVFRVSHQDLDSFASGSLHTITPAVFGTADGMRISEASSGGHPAAWRLRNGSLAFATLKGVALSIPNTRRQIRCHRKWSSSSLRLTISRSTDRFALHSARTWPPLHPICRPELCRAAKSSVQLQARGFDRGWVEAGGRRTAYYTNIPPGRYTFRVLACNNDGVWTESAATDLRFKRPHFYQTWLFDLLMLISLLVLRAILVYYRRMRGLSRSSMRCWPSAAASRARSTTRLRKAWWEFPCSLSWSRGCSTSSAESAKEHLDQARILVRNSLTEARSSIWDLRSQSVARAKTWPLDLTAMATRATASTSIKTQSKVGGAYRPLPARVESELLRIAQEAVTNAVRHANPRHISLELRFAVRQLRLTIEDDGCGFSGQPHPKSSGPEGILA